MGLFSGIKSTYKKSEAAVVVQNLLEIQAQVGLLELDPAKLANQLVGSVWDAKPDIYDGRFGQRPHKISVAASALARGALESTPSSYRDALVISLGNILSELEVNGGFYPLNSMDHTLIELAVKVLEDLSNEPSVSLIDAEPNDELVGGQSSFATWEEWYSVYKIEAGKVNPALEPDEGGVSLIDLMDDEPMKRAFNDGIAPKALAKRFAEQFDICTFGQ